MHSSFSTVTSPFSTAGSTEADARSPTILLIATLVSGALLLVAAMAGHASALGPRGCVVEPRVLTFKPDTPVTMIVRGDVACPIFARTRSATIEDLGVITPPQHGTLSARGRTGVIYRPYPDFKGEDFFAFTMRGRFLTHDGLATVQVRVDVQ